MSYASAADVAAELGRPASSTAESTQWEAWLDRVERAIERGFRQSGLVLVDQIALDEPTVFDVVDVEVGAVIRKIQNPSWGVTSTTRTIDDASVTDRREGGDASVDPLALTGDDWAALLPGTDSAAFSTRPGFEPDDALYDDSWVTS
jgi:hypothetical protein